MSLIILTSETLHHLAMRPWAPELVPPYCLWPSSSWLCCQILGCSRVNTWPSPLFNIYLFLVYNLQAPGLKSCLCVHKRYVGILGISNLPSEFQGHTFNYIFGNSIWMSDMHFKSYLVKTGIWFSLENLSSHQSSPLSATWLSGCQACIRASGPS